MSQSRQDNNRNKQDENQAPMQLMPRTSRPPVIGEAHIDSTISLNEIARLNNTAVHLYADVLATQVECLPACVRRIIIHPGITKNVILCLPRNRALKVETEEGVSDDIKLTLMSLEEPAPVYKPRFLKPTVEINPKKRKVESPTNDKGEPLFIENKKSRLEPRQKPSRKHARQGSDELASIEHKLKKMRLDDDAVNEKMDVNDNHAPVISSSFVPSAKQQALSLKRSREDNESDYTPQLFKKNRSKDQKQHAKKREREEDEVVNPHPEKKPRIQKLKNIFFLKEKPLAINMNKLAKIR